MSGPAIVIHGGCGRVEPDGSEQWTVDSEQTRTRGLICAGGTVSGAQAERRAGVREAAERGWALLREGGSALDAVTAAVALLEELPQFNAGRGAVLNAEGRIETDAAIMDGATRAAGAVACVHNLLHPVLLARRVMEASPHVLLCGRGAEEFAAAQGFTFCRPEELIVARRRQEWAAEHGTVGAVACDAEGGLAAATSTGGMTHKLAGRVGDTPLIGCGTYADENVAVSCTGHGEQIIRMTLARLAAFHYAASGDAQAAAEQALAELAAHASGEAGLILVGRNGDFAHVHNTPQMPVCAISRHGTMQP